MKDASEVVQFLKAKSNQHDFAYATIKKRANKWFWEVKVGSLNNVWIKVHNYCVNPRIMCHTMVLEKIKAPSNFKEMTYDYNVEIQFA